MFAKLAGQFYLPQIIKRYHYDCNLFSSGAVPLSSLLMNYTTLLLLLTLKITLHMDINRHDKSVRSFQAISNSRLNLGDVPDNRKISLAKAERPGIPMRGKC